MKWTELRISCLYAMLSSYLSYSCHIKIMIFLYDSKIFSCSHESNDNEILNRPAAAQDFCVFNFRFRRSDLFIVRCWSVVQLSSTLLHCIVTGSGTGHWSCYVGLSRPPSEFNNVLTIQRFTFTLFHAEGGILVRLWFFPSPEEFFSIRESHFSAPLPTVCTVFPLSHPLCF